MKLSQSGKAVQVILDDGTVYCSSASIVMSLISGKIKPFVVMSEMPLRTVPGKFPRSQVWSPDGTKIEAYAGVKDVFSLKAKQQQQQHNAFEDKSVL